MSKLDEPPFVKVIIGSAIGLPLIIIRFILNWVILASGTPNFFEIMMMIFSLIQNILLIILCAAILILSIVGKSVYYKNENIPLIFGILMAIASGVVLGFNIYYLISGILGLIIIKAVVTIFEILILIFGIAIIGLMVMSLVYSIKVAKSDTY